MVAEVERERGQRQARQIAHARLDAVAEIGAEVATFGFEHAETGPATAAGVDRGRGDEAIRARIVPAARSLNDHVFHPYVAGLRIAQRMVRAKRGIAQREQGKPGAVRRVADRYAAPLGRDVPVEARVEDGGHAEMAWPRRSRVAAGVMQRAAALAGAVRVEGRGFDVQFALLEQDAAAVAGRTVVRDVAVEHPQVRAASVRIAALDMDRSAGGSLVV